MAVRIRHWLEAQGFTSNPFEFWEADRETTLSSYFVRAEWFDALRGDTERPRSAVLFAPRGHGKSSHRLEIARICGDTSNAPALVVQITEYDWILAEGLEQVNSQRYLQYLARRVAESLWAAIQRSQLRQATFSASPRHLVQLYGLMRWSATRTALALPALSISEDQLRLVARQLGAPVSSQLDAETLIDFAAAFYQSAQQTELLGDMVHLTHAAGFVSLYVLVDRVDEDDLTEHNVDATLRLIQPLISNLRIIEFPGIAFKFFLPDHIHDIMLNRRISRIDERVPTYTLHWSKDELLELLARRLQFYSLINRTGDIGQVNTFQDLCEEGCNADELLVDTARGSPRRLIMLGGKIIEAHCQSTDDLESKINTTILRAQLQSNVPLLYLDDAGYIWFDRKKQMIRLTSLPRRLLELLWSNRTRYVTKVEVDRALYPSGERTDDALYKVVKRLREQLEPGQVNSKNYIDFVEGHGYRLRNYESDPGA